MMYEWLVDQIDSVMRSDLDLLLCALLSREKIVSDPPPPFHVRVIYTHEFIITILLILQQLAVPQPPRNLSIHNTN